MNVSKNIVILGSTGSIGRQALDIIAKQKVFKASALTAFKNAELLNKQATSFGVKIVAIADKKEASLLKASNPPYKVLGGFDSLKELASLEEADTVLNALVGSAGLEATVTALRSGKKLALANKESLVAGGEYLTKNNLLSNIVPVDSEHSALFQLFLGENKEEVQSLILTGSGGPFMDKTLGQMEKATVEQALKHPRWKMGPKITIDSATMMNKGLEIIEAHYLFDCLYEKIKVLVQPQSIIHSMVQFNDGSVKAHLGQTDMRIPIQYAFSYPKRLSSPLPMVKWGLDVKKLDFFEPDHQKFRTIPLAYEAGKKGKTYPAVLNASNEIAVSAFLHGKIKLTRIARIIEQTLEKHVPLDGTDLDCVKEADRWGKETAKILLGKDW